jgi:hypothetical protein
MKMSKNFFILSIIIVIINLFTFNVTLVLAQTNNTVINGYQTNNEKNLTPEERTKIIEELRKKSLSTIPSQVEQEKELMKMLTEQIDNNIISRDQKIEKEKQLLLEEKSKPLQDIKQKNSSTTLAQTEQEKGSIMQNIEMIQKLRNDELAKSQVKNSNDKQVNNSNTEVTKIKIGLLFLYLIVIIESVAVVIYLVRKKRNNNSVFRV